MQPGGLVGQTLGHYRVERQIGYGGMSTVFLAEDIHLDREVALKVFWPRPGETQDFLRRFAREARVLAQLDHPNILLVYDYGEEGELAFLVTPYMSGGTLRDVLRERRALPPSEAIRLLSQVLPALQYAHERNLIHRDIKPGNLLFKGDGSLVLADFGLVKVVEGERGAEAPLLTLTETGQTLAGTPDYMAPEQINGKAVPASDIYSMGVVLYEMVTGVRPFSGDSLLSVLMQQVNQAPRPPRELNPYVSLQLQAVILKAMAKDPKQRFAQPADFHRALQQSANPSSAPGLADPRDVVDDPYQTSQMSTEHGTAADWTDVPTAKSAAQVQSGRAGANGQGIPLTPRGQLPTQAADAQQWPQGPLVLPPNGNNPATPQPPIPAWNMSQTIPPPLVPEPVRPARKRSRVPIAAVAIIVALLAGLVASLFLTPLGTTLFGPHPGMTPTPVARASTTCPASGTARAAVTTPLKLGNDPTLVYIVNENDARGNPTFGTVKILDTVTGTKTELTKTNGTNGSNGTRITEAQVSKDGQWVLFAAIVGGQSELRMVGLDGQGLQTLLCAPAGMTIRGSQLSFDQQHVIFDEFPQSGAPTVYLLNMQSGALQTEIDAPTTGLALLPRTWLDNQNALMVGIVPNQADAPPQNIYVLNRKKGAHQSMSSAEPVFHSEQPCWDFDSSFDTRTLFITQCTLAQPYGSSALVRQPSNGGTPATFLNSPTLAFSTVRAIDNKSNPATNSRLLALAANSAPGTPGVDPAHDGLYLLKTDGSDPQRLTTTATGDISQLNAYSQYYWANVSRDDSMYALATMTPGKNMYALSYGPLTGGAPTTFASISDGTTLSIAGWTYT